MSIMPPNEPYAWLIALAAVLRGIAAVLASVRSHRGRNARRRP